MARGHFIVRRLERKYTPEIVRAEYERLKISDKCYSKTSIMPDVTRRRTGEFLRKLFEILMPHPEGMQARDAIAALGQSMNLTEYEKGTYESGGRRFDKIVRFATVDCVKAGWLLKAKGRWILTEAGVNAHATFSDPELFYRQAIKLYNEWRSNQPKSTNAEPETEEDVTEKVATITFEEAEEQSWLEIEHYLRSMNPYDFQELIASLLRALGYHVSWIAPPGRDGGMDIVASTDPLGTRSPRIKVQVKRQAQPIPVDGVRSFMGVLGEDDVGIFVSLGGFTKDAAEWTRTQQKRLTLIDLETFFDLWVEHYNSLTDDARRRLPLRPIYFLAPQP
jgi:restriction system protein